MDNIKRLRAFVLLSIGIAILAYSILAIASLMSSSRAVIMMGSVMQPDGAVSERRMVAAFLLLLNAAGLALVGMSIKMFVDAYKK